MIIQRRMDELGRIVLPIEVRQAMGLNSGGVVNIDFDSETNKVTFMKPPQICCCCGDIKDLRTLPNDQYICDDCLAQIK